MEKPAENRLNSAAIETGSFEDLEILTPETRDQKKKNYQLVIQSMFVHELGGVVPDVIIPLAGSIKQLKEGILYSSPTDEDPIAWSSLSYEDSSEHGLVTGGKARMIAAVHAAEVFPAAALVANSYNRFNADEPTMAAVTRQEFLRRGVDDNRIVLEEESFSTLTELIEMLELANANNWINISIITSDYHIPRVAEMMRKVSDLKEIVSEGYEREAEEAKRSLEIFQKRGGRIGFVAAEEILAAVNQRYGNYIHAVKQTPAYEKTIQSEARGLNQLKSDDYRSPLGPEVKR